MSENTPAFVSQRSEKKFYQLKRDLGIYQNYECNTWDYADALRQKLEGWQTSGDTNLMHLMISYKKLREDAEEHLYSYEFLGEPSRDHRSPIESIADFTSNGLMPPPWLLLCLQHCLQLHAAAGGERKLEEIVFPPSKGKAGSSARKAAKDSFMRGFHLKETFRKSHRTVYKRVIDGKSSVFPLEHAKKQYDKLGSKESLAESYLRERNIDSDAESLLTSYKAWLKQNDEKVKED